MLIYDIESAHTGTRQDNDISKYAGYNNVIFFSYNAYLPQHMHVLIYDIESAHTGTRQDNDISKYAGYINVNLFCAIMLVFPSTGMCLYVTLNQHTLVQGKTMTFQNMQVVSI